MMPAMSPLMTVGTIKRWRKKEGEEFFPGDVLLEIVSPQIPTHIASHANQYSIRNQTLL